MIFSRYEMTTIYSPNLDQDITRSIARSMKLPGLAIEIISEGLKDNSFSINKKLKAKGLHKIPSRTIVDAKKMFSELRLEVKSTIMDEYEIHKKCPISEEEIFKRIVNSDDLKVIVRIKSAKELVEESKLFWK